VKYGMISEEKFNDKAKDFALLKNLDGKFFTVEEYKKHIEANQTNKDKQKVFLYTTDQAKQHSYIEAAQRRGYDVLELKDVLDSHFINHVEQKFEVTMKRVDADVVDKLIETDEAKESVLSDKEKDSVKEVFEKAVNNKNNSVNVEPMATDDMPVTVTLPEFLRRMKDMQETGGGGPMMFGEMPVNLSISVNANHAMTKKILEAENEADRVAMAKQAYDLALLSQGMLEGKELTDFIKRSVDLASS
jgi:molecular chaperone HtpG